MRAACRVCVPARLCRIRLTRCSGVECALTCLCLWFARRAISSSQRRAWTLRAALWTPRGACSARSRPARHRSSVSRAVSEQTCLFAECLPLAAVCSVNSAHTTSLRCVAMRICLFRVASLFFRFRSLPPLESAISLTALDCASPRSGARAADRRRRRSERADRLHAARHHWRCAFALFIPIASFPVQAARVAVVAALVSLDCARSRGAMTKGASSAELPVCARRLAMPASVRVRCLPSCPCSVLTLRLRSFRARVARRGTRGAAGRGVPRIDALGRHHSRL